MAQPLNIFSVFGGDFQVLGFSGNNVYWVEAKQSNLIYIQLSCNNCVDANSVLFFSANNHVFQLLRMLYHV